MEPLNFTIMQMPNGLWVKERDDGRRGPCIGDEAVLWQRLQDSQALLENARGMERLNVPELVRENERLSREVTDLRGIAERAQQELLSTVDADRATELARENEWLIQACQRLADESHQFSLDNGSLLRENQRLSKENEQLGEAYQRLLTAHEALQSDWVDLGKEAEELRANQRRKPGRKPKDASGINITGGVPSEEHVQRLRGEVESDPLDEDL